MPAGRPAITLEPYKAVIWSWYIMDNFTLSNVRSLLHTQFPELCHARPDFPSLRTLERTLKQWGPDFQKKNQPLDETEKKELTARIWELFYTYGLNDDEIMRFLNKDGYKIQKTTMVRLRLACGMFRRTTSENFPAHDAIMREALQQQLKSGQSVLYGRSLSYQHLKKQGIPVARDRMYAILRGLDPIGVDQRPFGLQKSPRDAYIVPGPNFLWSVDGHHKLSMYGIEIYAAIDGYSRYITWIHVGISTRTAVAVLRQYLDTVEASGILPRAIRSDRGTETPMMANAHWQLHQALSPGVKFEDVYWFGTSTLNVKIESWWRQMSKSQTITWKTHLDSLRDSGLFTDNPACKIALLYVYLPIIRREIYEFAELWNAHRIRAQPKRPYLPTGKPIVLYHTPLNEVSDYAQNPPLNLLAGLQSEVAAYDPDEYLPSATIEWCSNELLQLKVEGTTTFVNIEDGTTCSYLQAYCYLRQVLEKFFGQGGFLSMSQVPTRGYDWEPEALQMSKTLDLEIDQELEFLSPEYGKPGMQEEGSDETDIEE